MISIVITGGIGSGKSLVCSYLEKRGYQVIYADQISRSLTAVGGLAIPEIEANFGADFICSDGSMDRARMRELVYSNSSAKAQLESIVSYKTKEEISRKLELAHDEEIVFVEIPLLYEMKSQDEYDFVWLVTADSEKRIERICSRDDFTREEALRIMNSQMPDEEKIALADETIYNNSSAEDLYKKVEELLVKYHEKIKKYL